MTFGYKNISIKKKKTEISNIADECILIVVFAF